MGKPFQTKATFDGTKVVRASEGSRWSGNARQEPKCFPKRRFTAKHSNLITHLSSLSIKKDPRWDLGVNPLRSARPGSHSPCATHPTHVQTVHNHAQPSNPKRLCASWASNRHWNSLGHNQVVCKILFNLIEMFSWIFKKDFNENSFGFRHSLATLWTQTAALH